MCLWKFTSTRLAWLGFSATDSALSTGHGSRSVATDCSEWRHSPPGIYRPTHTHTQTDTETDR